MFNKKSEKVKNSMKADSGMIFQRTEIDFYDFRTYCCNYTRSGDWVIPLGDDMSVQTVYDPEKGSKEITREEMCTKDVDGLITIYRHQDDNLVMKNPRMLGTRDPEKKGLIYYALIGLQRLDEIIAKLPKRAVEKVCMKLTEKYDSYMKDRTTGQVIETHIWIPLWRSASEKALLIHILDRINIIVT